MCHPCRPLATRCPLSCAAFTLALSRCPRCIAPRPSHVLPLSHHTFVTCHLCQMHCLCPHP
jgi:hypothetical protein